MRERSGAVWSAISMVIAAVCAGGAQANYPDRPLRYIVPQAPGSASDT